MLCGSSSGREDASYYLLAEFPVIIKAAKEEIYFTLGTKAQTNLPS
jgi:hypothetical protein